MEREFKAIGRRSKTSEPSLRVYCEAWPNPRISSPPWVAELVSICGGQMVVPAGERVHEKQVAAAEPDAIVLAWAAAGDRANPRKAYEVREWQGLPAIRNRRVHVISDELLNTPGPTLLKGAMALRNALCSQGQEKGNAKRQRIPRSPEA